MENREQHTTWEDIKRMWNESSEGKEIRFYMSELTAELKDIASQFEKEVIKKDIEHIKKSISQFEKDLLENDVQRIKDAVSDFEKNLVKSSMKGLRDIMKNLTERIKGRKK